MTAHDDAHDEPMIGSLIDAFKWVTEASQWEALSEVAVKGMVDTVDNVSCGGLEGEPTDNQRVALGIANEAVYHLRESIGVSTVAVMRCAAALERIAAALEAK